MALFNHQPVEPATASRSRLMLWIDGVGGYLVCLGQRVTLGLAQPGQAQAGRTVDIAVLGDVSSRHASFVRHPEGYLLEVCRPTTFNGQPAAPQTALPAEARLGFGSSGRVVFRFRQPHPLSRSAVLVPESGHRTQPPADGILLWADTLVLGPSDRCHVVCRDWPHEVILSRQSSGRWVQGPGELIVGGERFTGRAPLGGPAQIAAGDAMTLTIEEL